MNKKQIFVLIIGCLLISIHILLYFSNVQEKYERLRYEKQGLETNYSQSLSVSVKSMEESFGKVLGAWFAVSILLILGLGLSLWAYRKRASKTLQIIICLFSMNVLWWV